MCIMAIVANLACTERIFSKFGAVHTKIHNRMHPDKVRKMTLLKMDISHTYGPPPRSHKRKFGDDEGTLSQSPPDQSTSSTETDVDASDNSIPTFSNVVEGLIQDTSNEPAESDGSPAFQGREARLLKNLFQYPTASEPSPVMTMLAV
jgi:hypothetical protein